MRVDVPLAPAEVRQRLFEALGPARRLFEAFVRTSGGDPRALRYVIELPAPLVVQVALAPEEGQPARRLVAFEASRLPDCGRGLEAAVEEAAAGILGAMPEAAAAAAVLNASAAASGGLFLLIDASDELALLALAGPGRSLGEATVIGALGDAPETRH